MIFFLVFFSYRGSSFPKKSKKWLRLAIFGKGKKVSFRSAKGISGERVRSSNCYQLVTIID